MSSFVSKTRYKPWSMINTEMLPNVLMTCKFIFLLFLAHGFLFKIIDPFVPFIKSLDGFLQYPGLFKYTLQLVFSISGILLLFNVRVRTNSIILGLVVIIVLLSSKMLFRNHVFIGGCVFLLAGLTDKRQTPWLIWWQVAVVYFGTFISKVLDPEWQNGQFMHYWLGTALENPFYLMAYRIMPSNFWALFLSWSAIIIELIVCVLIVIPRKRPLAVWIMILFHGTMFTFVGTRFGYFIDDLFIVLIAVINWPRGGTILRIHPSKCQKLQSLIKFLDWDNTLQLVDGTKDRKNWAELEYNTVKKSNESAWRNAFLLSNGFYFIIFIINLGITFLFDFWMRYFLSNALFWTLVILYLPIPWSKILMKKLSSTVMA